MWKQQKVSQDQGTNYYTPTRVDFTKTYYSPPKIHGLSIESVDLGGVHVDSLRTPWKPMGNCKIQCLGDKILIFIDGSKVLSYLYIKLWNKKGCKG